MIESPGLLLTIIAFLGAIGPLVFIHEMGHYLVGRWCGIKAEAFSIGFGREVVGWTDRRGTRWKVACFGRLIVSQQIVSQQIVSQQIVSQHLR